MPKKQIFDLYQHFFGSRHFYKFNRILLRLGLRGIGISSSQDFNRNGEAYFLKANANRFQTVFDVGANQGHYARQVQALNPSAAIYAFEPHPASYRKLQQVGREIGLHTFNVAFGSRSGQSFLYDYAKTVGSGHASLYKGVMDEIHDGVGKQIPVTVQTIDQFAEENRIRSIDFLKIDTEGNEYDVLAGAHRLLAEGRINVIQFEFNKMNVVSRVFLKDFIGLLENYQLYRLLKDGLVPIGRYRPIKCEFFAYQNIVAIRSACRGALSLD